MIFYEFEYACAMCDQNRKIYQTIKYYGLSPNIKIKNIVSKLVGSLNV